MTELRRALEAAIARRNPLLVKRRLRPGLPEPQTRKQLARAGAGGALHSVVALYCWHDGCELHGEPENGLTDGFAPPTFTPLNEGQKAYLLQYGIKRDYNKTSFHFLPLRTAIVRFKDLAKAGPRNPRLAPLGSRYFPFLWNGSAWNLAVDTDPAGAAQVISIEGRLDTGEPPLRHAYDSFEDFLRDAIAANDRNELLSCLKSPGRPLDASG